MARKDDKEDFAHYRMRSTTIIPEDVVKLKDGQTVAARDSARLPVSYGDNLVAIGNADRIDPVAEKNAEAEKAAAEKKAMEEKAAAEKEAAEKAVTEAEAALAEAATDDAKSEAQAALDEARAALAAMTE